jgi:DNA uptake protein ComE-like DNA-binding protein
LPYWYKPNRPSLSELISKVKIDSIDGKSVNQAHKKRIQVNRDLKPIGLNHSNQTDWMSLGFSRRQAQVIINFRTKRGGFKSTKELLEVFVVDSFRFNAIEPFLLNDFVEETNMVEPITSSQKKKRSTLKLTNFNPNTIQENQLKQMEVPNSIIKNVLNYRSKVGEFKTKSDFRKLYTIDDSMYMLFKPYLDLPDSVNTSNTVQDKYAQGATEPLDLNLCDSVKLVAVKGIGPYTASLILDYRNRLGGFIHVNQLDEIKKIPPERWKALKESFFVVQNFQPRKLSLNADDFKTFLRHPYFEYRHVKKIFNYKNKHGKFTSLHALKNVGFIEKDYVEKVSPYLKVE